jgi:mitochondrial-processing peptidase subunit alpha
MLSRICFRPVRTRFDLLAFCCGRSSYHTYPDPNEVPRVSFSKSRWMRFPRDETSASFLNKSFQPNCGSLSSSSTLQHTILPFTEVTTMANGLRVASQDMYGLMSSFAFTVNAGSASETDKITSPNHDTTRGATQMLELTAFRNTESRSHHEVVKEMERMGGMMQCISSKENIMYCVDVLRENISPAMDLLADAVLRPQFHDRDLDEGRMFMQYQAEDLPAELLSRDAATMAAYNGSALGNHHYTPMSSAEMIDAAVVSVFRKKHYIAPNCILSGAGVGHDDFLKLANTYFGSMPNGIVEKRPSAAYKGGIHLNERELKEPFVKVSVGFEIDGFESYCDTVPVCVLQMLLGGGSSFSAGGPGKGMYTRLYRELLNRYHWVEGAEAFVALYNDFNSGIFGIDGTCKADDVPKMMQVLTDQLVRLAAQPVTDEELSRAKNMLKSLMLMQLESRLVLCEDIARQIATYNKRMTPSELSIKIDAVTKDDLQRIAAKMICGPPTVGAVGEDLSMVPPFHMMQDLVHRFKQQAGV